MGQHQSEDFFVTIVSLPEQVRGWLGALNKGKQSKERLLWAYDELLSLFQDFSQLRVLPFDQAALDQFHALRKQGVRIGTLDLRIAAIALARGATLLSRNLRDFRQVPGLVAEDWTR